MESGGGVYRRYAGLLSDDNVIAGLGKADAELINPTSFTRVVFEFCP